MAIGLSECMKNILKAKDGDRIRGGKERGRAPEIRNSPEIFASPHGNVLQRTDWCGVCLLNLQRHEQLLTASLQWEMFPPELFANHPIPRVCFHYPPEVIKTRSGTNPK